MTPARSCSPEDLARLACVPAAVRQNPRYAGDHAIRHYRERAYAELLADLEWDPATPSVAMVGGIGRMVIGPGGVIAWEPVGSIPEMVVRLPPPVEATTRANRIGICHSCPYYRAGNDQCGLCGCGFVIAERTSSAVAHCPGGRW